MIGDVLSPWHPETDQVRLKVFGKLSEELGELIAVVSRCIIQGVDEVNPDGGKPNRLWLVEEIADVEANLAVLKVKLNLNGATISERRRLKIERLDAWLAGLELPREVKAAAESPLVSIQDLQEAWRALVDHPGLDFRADDIKALETWDKFANMMQSASSASSALAGSEAGQTPVADQSASSASSHPAPRPFGQPGAGHVPRR